MGLPGQFSVTINSAAFCESNTLFFHRIGGEQTFAAGAKADKLPEESGRSE